MKKLVVLFLPIFLLFSCDEIPPDLGTVSGGGVSTGEIVQKVLIEEFTGVRCVNCPAGSEAIEQLIDIHGDRLWAISIHTGMFADPYTLNDIMEANKYDFRTDDGDFILDFLGSPLGFPTAVVDRKNFEGEDGLQLARSKWAGYIDQELAKEPLVGISMTGSINDDRVLTAKILVDFVVDAGPEDPKITIFITESNIKDTQLTPGGIDADYKHKHVLRDIITSFEGDSVDGSSSDIIELDYTYSLPADWNNSELTIIAVVHNSVTNKDILQVEGLEF